MLKEKKKTRKKRKKRALEKEPEEL